MHELHFGLCSLLPSSVPLRTQSRQHMPSSGSISRSSSFQRRLWKQHGKARFLTSSTQACLKIRPAWCSKYRLAIAACRADRAAEVLTSAPGRSDCSSGHLHRTNDLSTDAFSKKHHALTWGAASASRGGHTLGLASTPSLIAAAGLRIPAHTPLPGGSHRLSTCQRLFVPALRSWAVA